MDQFEGPILIERVAHLLNKNLDSAEVNARWAHKALEYWYSVGQPTTPYLDQLILASKNFSSRYGSDTGKELSEMCSDQNTELLIAQKTISHNFTDAISLLEVTDVNVSFYCSRLERILELMIMSKNWRSIDEIERRLEGHIKNICLNVSTVDIMAYQRSKLLVCASYFLQGRYFECLKHFVTILQDDNSILQHLSTPKSHPFIDSEELISMISLSAIVSIPLDNYEDFIHLEELEPFFQCSPMLTTCLNLLINTSYNKFFKIWQGGINDICIRSMFLDQQWTVLQSTMRHKVYFFYMRVSNRVQARYLSDTLGIDFNTVNKEINELIAGTNLNFDVKDNVICFQKRQEINNVIDGVREADGMLVKKIAYLRQRNETIRNLIQQAIIENNTHQQTTSQEEGMNVDEMNEHTDSDSCEDAE